MTNPKNIGGLNFSKVGSILEYYKNELEYLLCPYLYYGTWRSSFGCHTEDLDLYSHNYLIEGEPKCWYWTPPSEGKKLEKLAKKKLKAAYRACPDFIRHKSLIFTPDKLRKNGIICFKTTQLIGEMIVTFPYAFHWGFNLGNNVAEAVNFASVSWIKFGIVATACSCKISDQRNTIKKVDMKPIVRKYAEHL